MNTLTPKQLELLNLLAHGHTNREITQILWLSVSTVKDQNAKLRSRLGARNTCDAIRIAYDRGILPLLRQEQAS